MADSDAEGNDDSKLVPESAGHRWRNAALQAQFLAEIAAMRSSQGFGYLHHVELHQQRARELLLRDAALRELGVDPRSRR